VALFGEIAGYLRSIRLRP